MLRFTRPFAQPVPPHDLIAPNSRLATLRSMRLIFLIITAFFVFMIFYFVFFDLITYGRSLLPWQMLVLPLLFLFNSVFFTVFIQALKRLETLRLAAAQGDQRLRASEQPQPDLEARPFLMTINTYPVLNYSSLRFILLAAPLVAIYLYFSALPLFSWLWSLLMAVLFIILFPCSFVLFARFIRRPIEVTQEGIRSRDDDNKPVFTFWHEARLFARYPEPGPFHNPLTISYELSSASHVVRWTWTQNQSALNFLSGPFISLEEHSAQMQALCSLIVAKTGLSLYDLGKGDVSSDHPR